jgi:hypothetical protein
LHDGEAGLEHYDEVPRGLAEALSASMFRIPRDLLPRRAAKGRKPPAGDGAPSKKARTA